jgi:FkbM family methyltransferase
MVNAKEGQTLVDVGLFDGALLQELAKTTDHKLIGFEPNPGAAEIIQQKVDNILAAKGAQKPGSARVINAGASSEPGTMMLHVRTGNESTTKNAGSSFAYGESGAATTRGMYTSTPVRVTTLDAEIDEDVYMLKVDTQGWEPHVFHGALNLLRRHSVRFIVMEIAPYILCEAGWNPMQVAKLLNCLGYMCFDGRWEPTKDKSRKYAKRAQPGDLAACSCGACVQMKNGTCNRLP